MPDPPSAFDYCAIPSEITPSGVSCSLKPTYETSSAPNCCHIPEHLAPLSLLAQGSRAPLSLLDVLGQEPCMTPATEGRAILHHHTANLHCPGHPWHWASPATAGLIPLAGSWQVFLLLRQHTRWDTRGYQGQFWGYQRCPVPARPHCRGPQEKLEHHHGNHGCQLTEAQSLCGTGRL